MCYYDLKCILIALMLCSITTISKAESEFINGGEPSFYIFYDFEEDNEYVLYTIIKSLK